MDLEGLISQYKSFSMQLRDESYRKSITGEELQSAISCVHIAYNDMFKMISIKDSCYTKHLSLIQHIFQCLRNSCAGCEVNQIFIKNEKKALETALNLLQIDSCMLDHENEQDMTRAQRNALQFIGNLVSGNDACQDFVWTRIFPNVILSLMESLNVQLQDLLCMVIYNCTRERNVFSQRQSLPLLLKIIDLTKNTETEWGLLVLEHIVLTNSFGEVYNILTDHKKQRLVLIDLLQTYIEDDALEIPEDTMLRLSHIYEEIVESVLSRSISRDDDSVQHAEFLMPVLGILCKATTLHTKYRSLQTRRELLDVTVCFLKQIDMEEKKQADRDKTLPEKNYKTEGIFGLKRDLVRLIGNMCYENKNGQERVRELDGIPVILNNCKIDETNPYISQWAIFAIRNLCQGNLENQHVISEFEKQGIVDSQEFQRQGMKMEMRDGKIRLGSEQK